MSYSRRAWHPGNLAAQQPSCRPHSYTVAQLPGGAIAFANRDQPVLTRGFDTYVQAVIHEWELYAGFTYTVVTRNYLAGNPFVPLTPRNRSAFTIDINFEKTGIRFGVEGSYNGSQ